MAAGGGGGGGGVVRPLGRNLSTLTGGGGFWAGEMAHHTQLGTWPPFTTPLSVHLGMRWQCQGGVAFEMGSVK